MKVSGTLNSSSRDLAETKIITKVEKLNKGSNVAQMGNITYTDGFASEHAIFPHTLIATLKVYSLQCFHDNSQSCINVHNLSLSKFYDAPCI